MNGLLFRYRLLGPPLAAALLVLGERVLGAGSSRYWFTAPGLALLVAIFLWELLGPRVMGSRSGVVAGGLGRAHSGLFLLAVALYSAGSGLRSDPSAAVDWAGLLGWGWIITLLVALPMFLLVELAWRGQRYVPRPDVIRLRRAAATGASLGLLLALIVTVNFIFNRLGWESDLAYFKTSEPSQTTMEELAALEEKIEVALFFPEDSPVLSQIKSYFTTVGAGGGVGSKVEVSYFDADLRPKEAKKFRVRGNGYVVLLKGSVRKVINLGNSLERARRKLRKLDGSFLKELLGVSHQKKTAYFTIGHGEESENQPGTPAARKSNKIRQLLAGRNVKSKNLGFAEGLGREIPKEAALVVILAPKNPFLPAEIDALWRYLAGGGKLLVFLEPELELEQEQEQEQKAGSGTGTDGEAEGGLEGLLADYGLLFSPVLQANDRLYFRRTRTKADHAMLVTIAYAKHPAVSNVRKRPKENPLLMMGAGAWRAGTAPEGLVVSEIVKAMKGTWGDLNRNFTFDKEKEKRFEAVLGISVAPPPGSPRDDAAPAPRIIGFADADMALDFLMDNRANRLVLTEAVEWLLDAKREVGLPATEEDVKIIHAKGDELVWFYLPVFGVPLAILGIGFLLSGRPPNRRRSG